MDWLMAGTSPAFITICYNQRVPAKRQLTERPERPKNPKSAHHLLIKLPVDRWRQMERVIPPLSPFRPINSIVHWLIGTSVHKLQVENWTFSRLIVCELKSGGRGGRCAAAGSVPFPVFGKRVLSAGPRRRPVLAVPYQWPFKCVHWLTKLKPLVHEFQTAFVYYSAGCMCCNLILQLLYFVLGFL